MATVICDFEDVVKPGWNPKAPVNFTGDRKYQAAVGALSCKAGAVSA